jgi:Protein of unknown function (DUF1501)
LGRSDVVQVQAAGQGTRGPIGRDHDIDAFTVWMTGGGVRARQTRGATDEIGFNPVERAIHVHDLQATILYLLGLDHRKLTLPRNSNSSEKNLILAFQYRPY